MYIQTGELVVHLSTKQTSLPIDRVNFQLVVGLFFWRTAVGVWGIFKDVTYYDVLKVLLMSLLMNPRIDDFSLFGLKSRNLILSQVRDVPIWWLLLRIRL